MQLHVNRHTQTLHSGHVRGHPSQSDNADSPTLYGYLPAVRDFTSHTLSPMGTIIIIRSDFQTSSMIGTNGYHPLCWFVLHLSYNSIKHHIFTHMQQHYNALINTPILFSIHVAVLQFFILSLQIVVSFNT